MEAKGEMLENYKGLDTATLVTVSNPRLPGSVVGEESMNLALFTSK
jgi:hypothetical protein